MRQIISFYVYVHIDQLALTFLLELRREFVPIPGYVL